MGMSSPSPITAEQLAALPPETRALVQAIVDHYEGRIAELEARLKKTPQNSSLPPSEEHPHTKSAGQKPPLNKKRGGEPGLKKHERLLIPTEACDDLQPLKPTECRRCGAKLVGRDPEPPRHQVWEVPPIEPDVTEYRRQRLRCPSYDETTWGALPARVGTRQAGPRLVALTALLMGCVRQSKSRVALFPGTDPRSPCSTGWVMLQNEPTAALGPAYDELVAAMPDEPVVSMDETPTKEAN